MSEDLQGIDRETLEQGEFAYKCQQYAVALQRFHEFLLLGSERPLDHPIHGHTYRVHSMMATCQEELGNPEIALQEWNNAISAVSPYDWASKGIFLLNRFDLIAQHPRRFLIAEIGASKLELLEEGLEHSFAGRYVEAEEELGSFIPVLPETALETHAVARRHKSFAMRKQGRPQDGIAELERGLEWYGDRKCYGSMFMELLLK